MVCFKNCTITSKHVHCCIHVRFWDGIFQFLGRTYLVCVASSRPILLVRTSFHTVFSCDNNSVFINPTLRTSTDFYCLLVLLVRQKQRFDHPTLRTTSDTLVVCIEKIKGCRVYNLRPTDMPIKSKRVHCCIHAVSYTHLTLPTILLV